jgi:hypothetical protein
LVVHITRGIRSGFIEFRGAGSIAGVQKKGSSAMKSSANTACPRILGIPGHAHGRIIYIGNASQAGAPSFQILSNV